MTLNELTIRGFGKFHDRTFTFSDGINILYGKNESGKSTLHSFLRAMLFGMERARGRAAKTDFFAHFEPWFGDGAYGGTLKFTEGGHVYRLERNFSKNPLDLSITDETEGKEVPEPGEFLSKLLGNLSVTAFDNTVSIGQLKSSTDAGLVNELKNYIANMNTSGNMSLNITKACAYLKDQRRAFERQIVQDAAKNYAANLAEIRKIEETLASPDYVNHISELKETKEAAVTAQGTLQKEREKLLQRAAADQQTLRGKRFEGREDITAFRGSCSACLKEYEEAEKLASSWGTRNSAVLTVILALLAACAGFWSAGNAPEGFAALPLNMICWIAAGILAVISVLCFHTASVRKQNAKAASDRFLDTVREHFPELLPPTDAAGPENLKNCRNCMEQVEKETDGLLLICDNTDQGGKMLQEIDGRLEMLKTQQSDTEATIAAQQKSQWELERQLEHLSNLKNEASALKRVVAENDRLRTEIEAIDIARDTMTRLSVTIRDSFGLYLNRNASELIAGITGGIYTSLSIDQDLNVSLNTEKKLVPLEQVSSGTMDQVYLALRLASADLMRKDGVQLPLFLDDSFVNYDEDRLRTVLKWLPETFPDRQILVFSCHRREAQLLSANLIPYTLTEIA
jgi:DNA repair exonuclease SbcCD ATPase subunit